MKGAGAIAANFAGMGGYFLLRQMGIPMMSVAVVLAWAVGIMAVGWLVGRILSNSLDCDSNAVQALSWSQLAAWIIPPLGLFLSMATWELAGASNSNGLKMRMLAGFGGLAAIACGGIGLLIQYRPIVG
jgi:hypothetical protein